MNTSRLTLIAVLVTFSCSIASAQGSGSSIPPLGAGSAERIDIAVRNYEKGLASGNEGLVESSLHYAVLLRLTYPKREFAALEKAVDRLVAKGVSARIRYKAFLASTVFASPLLVDARSCSNATDSDAMFADIARQLDGRLLVSK